MALTLTARSGLVELRRILVDAIAPGESMIVDVDLVASADHAEARLAATVADWVSVSSDGGLTYWPLGTEARTGYDLGPQSAGQRTPLKVRITPQGNFRQRRIGLVIGEGV